MVTISDNGQAPVIGIRAGVAERIKTLREARGLTQGDLAKRLDKSRSAIAQWELGNALPDVAGLAQVAEAFAVTPQYMAYGVGETTGLSVPIMDYTTPEGGGQTGAMAVDSTFLQAWGKAPPHQLRAFVLPRDGMIEGLHRFDVALIDEADRNIEGRGESVLFFDGVPDVGQVRRAPGQGDKVSLHLGRHMVEVRRGDLQVLGRVVGTLAAVR